ncbi:hypothetical protein AAFF_G00185610 [Aldrovandia affinis]|uniref:Gypsy retrotransposon integrase-like protein 1 n=1 Tax=Aldrovandia affinis TaxID=143900 RepID=A0AAD7RJY2_9TELE|nr:hypothetical protein AAFF_G00185610 [Aldrovandia affinis]
MLSMAPALAYYDITKVTVVSADASSFGLGAALLQVHDGKLKPVAFGSRKLTDAERRYSQIEKECLAAVWACEQFALYLQVHVPGKQLVLADTLSRNPLQNSGSSETEAEVQAYVEAVMTVSKTKLDTIREATRADMDMQMVIHYNHEGWPKHVPYQLKGYSAARAALSAKDGLLLYGDRIAIPTSLREEVLQQIHRGHQGLTKSREHAKMSVWWPDIGADINRKVTTFCSIHKALQRKEPLITMPLPPEFKQFDRDYDFSHSTSSPHYPQANGAAERVVQTAKRILRQPDPYMALMCYRTTPVAMTGVSPTQLMTGQLIRTTLPMLESKLSSQHIDHKAVDVKDKQAKKTYKYFYNRRHGVRDLPELLQV